MLAWTSPTNAPRPGWLVDVLHDDDPWRRHADDVAPPVGAVVITVADRRRRRTADPRRHRVTDHRGLLRKHAADPPVGKTLVAQPEFERLDGVRHRRAVETAVAIDQLRCQYRHAAHSSSGEPAGRRQRPTWELREVCGRGRAKRRRDGEEQRARRRAAAAATNRVTGGVSKRSTAVALRIACAGAANAFLGGQSTFRKLGASDDVSSRWPTRVNAGTQIRTTTPISVATRAASLPDRYRDGSITKNVKLLLYRPPA